MKELTPSQKEFIRVHHLNGYPENNKRDYTETEKQFALDYFGIKL
jgi:hypothetical protein